MNGNVIRTITIKGTSEGLDKVTADLNKLASAQENVAVVSEQSAKRVLSLEDAWKRQTLKLDEAARAQANIARETKVADAALREGIATQAQHAQRLEQINQRYATVTTATKGFAQQTGLARHELVNLGRQAQDVGVSLASGQSPLTVLVQQGTQIADVFATSGGTLRGFFTQAIDWAGRFLSGWGGIAAAVAAVGAAAVYGASQFKAASTTIEEALKEQNRLLKEGKTLLDAKASAEAKAQAQAKDLTEYEIMRNKHDLQLKINKAMDDAAKLAQRTTRPIISPGVMGEPVTVAPEPFNDSGLKKITAAWEQLKVAQASSLPGLKEYVTELGRIGMAHPELRETVDVMIQAGRASVELDQAKFSADALAAALAGVANNAQLAALGYASMAQFKLSTLEGEQLKDSTERRAKAVLEMAAAYPGMSIEGAKQLHTAEQQLTIAQQTTGLGQINAQYEATINNLKLQGLSLSEAIAVADAQRAVALAQVNAQIEQQVRALEQSTELIRARESGAEASVKAEQAYTNAIRDGADEEKARALQQATWDNEHAQARSQELHQSERAEDSAEGLASATRQAADAAHDMAFEMELVARAAQHALDRVQKFVPLLASSLGGQMYQSNQGGYSQFNPAGYTSTTSGGGILTSMMTNLYGQGGFDPVTGQPNAQGLAKIAGDREKAFESRLAGSMTAAGGNLAAGVGSFIAQGNIFTGGEADPQRLSLLNRYIDLMSPEQQASSIQGLMGQLQQAPQTLQTAEMMKSLGEKLTDLTRATDDNTNATSAMTDVLSPYYSSDPRRTHLGFRAFAGGGIMTHLGELPLRQYQGGGMATSPQVAVFGEGSTPEAYVPVPSGRIPVEIRTPANSNRRPVNVTINVMGDANANTVAALKATAFQQAQAMRRVMG